MEGITAIIFCSTLLLSISTISIAVDTIRLHQTIRDGNTIVSAGGEFELGFFSPDMSTNRYVGIWYKRISHGTVVWVANRQTPLTDTSGVLTVDSKAIKLLVNGSNTIIWSSNLSPRLLKNPVVQLLDNGNLVLKDRNGSDPQNDNFVWQSFDYPGDTMLPGMKFGVDLVTGLEKYYTSWKSSNDPSLGYYSNRLDHHGYPQLILWKGSLLQSRTGPWTGEEFSGNPIAKPNGIYTKKFVMNPNEIYYAFDLVNKSCVSAVTRLILTPNGDTRRLIWIDQDQEWTTYVTLQVSDCDRYGLCGSYSTCNINKSPRCECLSGFFPKFPEKWEAADWSAGCIRRTPLVCGNRDGFAKYSGIKLPDTRLSRYHMNKSLEECQNLCSNNCSCSAYANTGTPGVKSVCLLWFDELMDVTEITGEAQNFYVRMVASELEASGKPRVKKRTQIIVVPVVMTVSLALALAFILLYVLKRRKMKLEGRLRSSSERVDENEREDIDLPLFDFTAIANATNNFSQNNKLGEGGFGLVYKGTLENGQAIAVKRLSQHSHQGIDEFKNEVSCICKLQHRNLVSLLGCCIDKREKILIYEYMPNKSLDSFVFDQAISKSLDWPNRCNIINGIARGLLYLHQDSKLRIIHRDIKASNILLDHDMNPKISDFGMARSFSGTQTEANTTRVVGTYGYMSPEYAIDGQFSIKSDVYSFGVLLIEIVSGKRNRCFDHPDHSHNLLGHAWKSFVEGKILDVIDVGILGSSKRNEVSRAIQIGLLCVQQYPQDRPSMSAVVFMLNSKTALAQPKEPGFFTERKQHQAEYSTTKPVLFSFDEFTISDVSTRF